MSDVVEYAQVLLRDDPVSYTSDGDVMIHWDLLLWHPVEYRLPESCSCGVRVVANSAGPYGTEVWSAAAVSEMDRRRLFDDVPTMCSACVESWRIDHEVRVPSSS